MKEEEEKKEEEEDTLLRIREDGKIARKAIKEMKVISKNRYKLMEIS